MSPAPVSRKTPETPAIEGGQPLVPEGPPAWPFPDPAIREALNTAYADGSWGRYAGPAIERLSEQLAAMHGVTHAWPCSSGTIAVELALRGVKVGPGDEVILAGYDFAGNFRAVEAVGARPVLVDVTVDGWCLDADQALAAATPATKAIIASHLHGSLVDMQRLCSLAEQKDLAVIEDACQVPGAKVQGRVAGSWGDCGILSFGGSKLLTAGRGGAILTRRDEVLQRIKIYSQRGNEAFPLSELQAAVLPPQLTGLAAANARRLSAAQRLIAECASVSGIRSLALPGRNGYEPAFYKVPFTIGSDSSSDADSDARRRRFIAAAQAEGLAIDEGFRGFARRTTNRCRVIGDLPHARRAAASTVVLHHPVLLSPDEVLTRVGQAIGRAAEYALRP